MAYRPVNTRKDTCLYTQDVVRLTAHRPHDRQQRSLPLEPLLGPGDSDSCARPCPLANGSDQENDYRPKLAGRRVKIPCKLHVLVEKGIRQAGRREEIQRRILESYSECLTSS